MSIFKGFTATKPKTGEWIDIQETEIVNKDTNLISYKMRNNQLEVFNNHRDDQFCIINQPPGSGKSKMMKFVFGHNLNIKTDEKIIIAAPQTLIGKTFRHDNLIYPDDSKINWDVGTDLCDDINGSKVQEIIDFILKKKFPNGIHERILLCTHASLSIAYERINKEGLLTKKTFKNTTIVIDEAHHILNAQNDTIEMANKIGSLIKFALKQKSKTIKIWLLTATFFRGDKYSILPEKYLNKFSRHHLPIDKHWKENIKYIKSYTYDFIIYNGKPWKEIKELLKKQKEKTIIYCPANNRPLADGCKYTFTSTLKKEIHKVCPEAVICDLVDEDGRKNRKENLMDEKNAKDIDIVLTIAMFDEGSDWDSASQIIDLSPSNSLRIVVQRWGRLLRDKIGKKHIRYYNFLPFVLDTLDEEEYRKQLTKNFAVFTASLLLEECISPVPITRPEPDEDNPERTRNVRVDYFSQEVKDETKRQKILQDVHVDLITLRDQADETDKILSSNDYERCIKNTLKRNKVKKHREEIAMQIVGLLRRRLPDYQVDVTWMVDEGFDKIWKDEILDYLLQFGSKSCGIKTFKEFRDIYNRVLFLPFEEAKDFAIKLKLKNLAEWQKYCKSGKKPNNIPSYSNEVYKNKGLISWGYFLGTGYIAHKDREYLPFEEAREFIRELELKTYKEWEEYSKSGKRPNNIPGSPYKIYKNIGWTNMADWLGNGKRVGEYLPFKEAREFIRDLKLRSKKNWEEYSKSSKRPNNIPGSPNVIYKDKGWINMADWLGNGKRVGEYLPFKETREFVRKLKLKGQKEWKEYCKSGKKPNNITGSPNIIYKDKGWISMGDFLGTEFLSFEDARKIVRELGLKNAREWVEYCKSGKNLNDIPANPQNAYKDKCWTNWKDFLGTEYLSFEEAKEFVMGLKLKTFLEWREYSKSGKKLKNLPSTPEKIYKKDWTGWHNFLGTSKK